MSSPPDRICIDPGAPDYDRAALARGIEISFNGFRQVNCVVAYCVSEGWVIRRKVTALGVVKRDALHQEIRTDRVYGRVEVSWRD